MSDPHMNQRKMPGTTPEQTPLLALEKPTPTTAATKTNPPFPSPSPSFDYPILLGLFNTIALLASAILLLVCLCYFCIGAFYMLWGCFPPNEPEGRG